MDKAKYSLIENYMLECMRDAAHDKEHIYRVLYNALYIAEGEQGVDNDVLVAACLLHDIGREEQFRDPSLDHAEVGGDKAYAFLTAHGFDKAFAEHVKSCIEAHRFRKDRPPESVEAKILFDADKLDVSGAMGVARTLVYKGGMCEPLYTLGDDGFPSNGENGGPSTFFREYNYKLKNLYSRFYTERGKSLAEKRRAAAENFYAALLGEVTETYALGKERFAKIIDNK